MNVWRILLLVLLLVQGVAPSATFMNTLPPQPVRVPAEFEPCAGVLIQWDFGECDDFHRWLVGQITAADALVYIIVDNAENRGSIAAYLEEQGASGKRVRYIKAATDSIWARDYCPEVIYAGETPERVFVDWRYTYPDAVHDDNAAVNIGKAFGWDLYRADRGKYKLRHESGDFMTDGFGTGIASTKLLDENGAREQVGAVMRGFLGVTRGIILERLRTGPSNHIDMYMKLLDEETVLIGEYGPAKQGDPIIEQNVAHLREQTTCYGTPYRFVRVPMPGDTGDKPDYRTYTNSLIVNDHVLVPVYGVPADEEAVRIYREAMPGYTIATYDCSAIVTQKGAIHCVTQQVPRSPGKVVRIGHARLHAAVKAGEPLELRAKVWARGPVEQVTAHVRMPGAEKYSALGMSPADGSYTVSIPTEVPGEVRYCIAAGSGEAVGFKPQNGDAGGYLTATVRAPAGKETSGRADGS